MQQNDGFLQFSRNQGLKKRSFLCLDFENKKTFQLDPIGNRKMFM